jgi:hypothetical protein
MGTKLEPQNELDSYHTSDSCVTRGRGRLHGARSRFLFEFGRINVVEGIGASQGGNQGA